MTETCVYCGEDIEYDDEHDTWWTFYKGHPVAECVYGDRTLHQPYDPDPPDMSGSTEGDR